MANISNPFEKKPGQGLDNLKQVVVNPVLVDGILSIPELPQTISLIDIGTGDGTTVQDLLSKLKKNGHRLKDVALIDADTKIFADLTDNQLQTEQLYATTHLVNTNDEDITKKFFDAKAGEYDIATCELVLHQIPNIHQASYLMYLAHKALKPRGELLVVNLHPLYLEFLAKYEPRKFKLTSEEDQLVTGEYAFDNGTIAPVYSRSIENQMTTFIGLGFDISRFKNITPNVLVNEKERYKTLADRGIPMFYMMQLRKNPQSFVSSTEATIKKITERGDKWLEVEFIDNTNIRIPKFNRWDAVASGDELILQETRRTEKNISILNYWVKKHNEGIQGGMLVIRSNKD